LGENVGAAGVILGGHVRLVWCWSDEAAVFPLLEDILNLTFCLSESVLRGRFACGDLGEHIVDDPAIEDFCLGGIHVARPTEMHW
ncbi:MAG: hypothetical protein ACK42I_09415, partial [Thermomicrobium sp.]